jgi:hypothetical protein
VLSCSARRPRRQMMRLRTLSTRWVEWIGARGAADGPLTYGPHGFSPHAMRLNVSASGQKESRTAQRHPANNANMHWRRPWTTKLFPDVGQPSLFRRSLRRRRNRKICQGHPSGEYQAGIIEARRIFHNLSRVAATCRDPSQGSSPVHCLRRLPRSS